MHQKHHPIRSCWVWVFVWRKSWVTSCVSPLRLLWVGFQRQMLDLNCLWEKKGGVRRGGAARVRDRRGRSQICFFPKSAVWPPAPNACIAIRIVISISNSETFGIHTWCDSLCSAHNSHMRGRFPVQWSKSCADWTIGWKTRGLLTSLSLVAPQFYCSAVRQTHADYIADFHREYYCFNCR